MFVRMFLIFLALGSLSAAHAGELEQAQFVQVTTSFNQHYERAQYRDAIVYGERAVKLASSLFGPNSPEVVTLLNNLANCHLATFNRPKALEAANQALARVEAGGSGDDVRAVRTLIILGRIHGEDDRAKAKGLLTRAVKIQEAAYGKNDPRLADALRVLGNNTLDSSSPLQARRFFERAVEVTANAPPEFAESRAMSLFELGRFEMAVRDFRDAEKHLLGVLDARAGHPPNDPLQLMTRSFLIELYDRMGEPEKATQHVQYLTTLEPQEEFAASQPLLKVVPEYPEGIYGKEGEVIMMATIDETGRVVNARVIRSDLPDAFGKEALKAISRWRYKPRIVDGKFTAREDVELRAIFGTGRR